jgi:NAD(P)-dependent dehydrogenase (short-subunit alcohol dehydrogenase family)
MADGTLEGRTAIVTGAGQGVGRGIALALAADGANVVVATRRAETGSEVVAEIEARGGTAVCIVADVTVRADVASCVAATIERFGGLEIMVHNAYKGGPRHEVEDVDAAFWWPFSRTTMWGSLYCAQAAFSHLRTAGHRGRLVFVSSASGIDGSVHLPLYAAPKGAQRALAKSLAREWGRHGFTVNCIAPLAASPELAAALERTPALKEQIESRTPLGRVGDLENDIGRVVAFLSSDDAGYVHGQTLVCDGGNFIGL